MVRCILTSVDLYRVRVISLSVHVFVLLSSHIVIHIVFFSVTTYMQAANGRGFWPWQPPANSWLEQLAWTGPAQADVFYKPAAGVRGNVAPHFAAVTAPG
jgi:hypothetical protein